MLISSSFILEYDSTASTPFINNLGSPGGKKDVISRDRANFTAKLIIFVSNTLVMKLMKMHLKIGTRM